MDEIYEIQNPHWNKKKYDFPLKRDIFSIIERNLFASKLILSIEGGRRVGKSVVMKQLINTLIEKNINPLDIFYFSFDNFDKNPLKVLKEYEKKRGRVLSDGKIFVFFDEIQYINNWQTELKIIYDNYPNIKMVISGSTLRSSKKESLAGRIYEYHLTPLTYPEYLKFSGNENILNNGIDNAHLSEYNIYLYKQYPELAINKYEDAKSYVTTLIRKVILEDSEKFIKNINKDLLLSLFGIILRDPGQIMDYSNLGNDFGVDRRTISEYMNFLLNSGLIRKLYNYSNNARKTEIKAKKFYPFCTTLIKYIIDNPDMSKVIETDIGFQLDAHYFWNSKTREEIDFIVFDQVANKKQGVEVKYRHLLSFDDTKTLISKSASKLKLTEKFLIIKDNAITDFYATEVSIIKYYLLWKYIKNGIIEFIGDQSYEPELKKDFVSRLSDVKKKYKIDYNTKSISKKEFYKLFGKDIIKKK